MQEGCFALQARISSYETDLFSKLSSMARYFQEIAGRQLRENGLSYTFLREHGYVFLITKLNLLVYRYPKHMQDVVFETWAKPLGKGAEFIRCYEVRDLHGTVLAEATTHWVLADPVTHKIVRPTSWPYTMPMVDRSARPAERYKLAKNPDAQKTGERPVRFSDLDYNGHLNNAIYLDIIGDFLPADILQHTIAELRILFRHEAMLGDNMEIYAGHASGDLYTSSGVVDGKPCYEAEFRLQRRDLFDRDRQTENREKQGAML